MGPKDGAFKGLGDALAQVLNEAAPAIERGLKAISREEEEARQEHEAEQARIRREHDTWTDELKRRR